MAKTAPSPVDVLDFQFKLQTRLKIFENDSHEPFKKPCGLVAAASRFGLVFVGTSSPAFQVIEVQDIQNYTVKDGDVANYRRRTVPLPSIPRFLSVNCDSTKLCVVVVKDGCAKAVIYSVVSFLQQIVSVLQEIRLSTIPGVNVVDLCWNPSVPSMLVTCKDDGTLGLYDVKDNGLEIKELPKSAAVTCLCWSPKGKQIVVGSADGKLTQYKLDLQVAKVVNAPPVNGNPYPVSLQWISNYQFVAVYKTNGNDVQMSLLVVDSPKNAEASYTNYDDVCYSYGNARPYQFYMLQQPLWNVLLVASSNSMEVGIMHLEKDSWTQWILIDSARAELPLSAIKQDTLPVGMAFDLSANKPIPWGEGELPPAPYLFLLSHQGVLCCFYTLNLKEGAPKICTPPEVLPDRSGAGNFNTGQHENTNPMLASSITNLVKPTPVPQPTVPVFVTNISTQQSFVSPTLVTSQKIPIPTFFNKPPTTSTPSLFGVQPPQPFTTLKTDPQPTIMITKPQIDVKKIGNAVQPENNQKSMVMKPAPTQQQAKQLTSVEIDPSLNKKAAASGIPAINEETERLLAQMIKEECGNLDMEMRVLMAQGSGTKVDLGSDLEAMSIVEGATVLQDFLKEMNEISTTQAAEIHVLKQNLIQTWVWYEEARSRFATYKDPALKSILLAQPLDAASERKLDEIRHLIYYLESQLVQANSALDEQWDVFQDSCKKKLSTRIPNIEAIYQVMVKQNATLQKQVYILKDISMRIRAKLRNVNTPRLLVTLENTSELEEQLKSLHMEPKDLVQIRYEKVLKRQKKLKGRIDKLKECFQNGNVSHITVRKPVNNSFMQLSGFGVMSFSPIAPKKASREERIGFVQSTPLPENQKLTNAVMDTNPPHAVLNLFKQEAKPVGGDVKTSAFVPMVNAKNNLFAAGNLDQNTLFNQKMQKGVVENISKPTPFNFAPPNAAVVTQKSSNTSFFGSVQIPATSEFSNKQSIPLSPSVSISLIKPNESPASKPNTFTQFSLPTTQSFSFAMTKPAGNVTLLSPVEKTSSTLDTKLTAVPEGTKSLFSSIFGQAAKSAEITKSPSTILGDKNIFGQSTIAATTESKPFTIEKPAAIFGHVQQSNTSSASKTSQPIIISNQTVPSATTSAPNLFSQAFISNVSAGQTEVKSSIFGQMSATTTSSTFVPTTSSFLFGQGTPSFTTSSTAGNTMCTTSTINSQQISIPTIQKTSVITTTQNNYILTTKPAVTINEEASTIDSSTSQSIATSLPAFGQPTTTIAIFGNTTATTSIFTQPVVTTKSAGVIQQLTTTPTIVSQITPTTTSSPTQQSTTPSIATTLPSSFVQITSSGSVFSQKQPSVFGIPTTTTVLGQATTPSPSLFGRAPSSLGENTSSGTGTIFGQTPSVFSNPATTATSAFTTTTTPFMQSTMTPAIFGQTPTSTTSASVFVTTTTPFVQSATPFVQSTTAPFVQSTTTPAVFGQTMTSTMTSSTFVPTPTSPTLLGQPPTTSSSVFGQVTSTPSIFGQATATPTVFGQPTSTSSIFGQTTSTPSVFGQTTATPNIFGQTTLAQSPTPISSIFGQTTASPSVFGQTTLTPAIFGQTTSTPSIFGGQTTTTPSVFGQTTTTPSVFGQTTSTPSVFGQMTSTQSIFGQPTSSPSTFGQPTSRPNIFGQQTSTSNVFGQATSAPTIFGQPSSPIFGQATSSASIFGQPQQSIFGQQTSSVFGQPSTTSSIFGQPTTSTPSVFGQNSFASNSVFKTSNNSVFGGTSPFGQTPTTTSVFGSPSPFGSSNVFGGNTTNNVFAKSAFGTADNLNFGALNAGSGPNTTTSAGNVFGSSSFNSFRSTDKDQPFNTTNNIFESSSTTSTPSIFGNSPFSKSTPAFGGPATFGSSPTFSQPSGFGSSFASNTTFGGTNQPGPFSGGTNTQTVSQSGFGSPTAFQKPPFISQPSFGSQSAGFGSPATFGTSTYGGSAAFGSPNRVFGASEGFGPAPQQQSSTFANLANQQTIGFGSVAQQAPVENMQQPTFTGGSSFTSWR